MINNISKNRYVPAFMRGNAPRASVKCSRVLLLSLFRSYKYTRIRENARINNRIEALTQSTSRETLIIVEVGPLTVAVSRVRARKPRELSTACATELVAL